jgi:hypothetical protein
LPRQNLYMTGSKDSLGSQKGAQRRGLEEFMNV